MPRIRIISSKKLIRVHKYLMGLEKSQIKILITGGCGFPGSSLAIYLRERGHVVIVMDNLVRRGSESNIERLEKNGITFVHGDVRCVEDFKIPPAGIELVCDVSAQPSVVSGYSNPTFDLTNNTYFSRFPQMRNNLANDIARRFK